MNKKKIQVRRNIIALCVALGVTAGGFTLVKTTQDRETDSSKSLFSFWDNTAEENNKKESNITISGIQIVDDEDERETDLPVIKENEDGLKEKEFVVTRATMNVRLSPTTDSFIVGTVEKDHVINKLLDLGEWILVRDKETIGYIKKEYTDNYRMNAGYDDFHYENYKDIGKVIEKTVLRVYTTEDSTVIREIEEGEELQIIGKATIKETDEVWYLAKIKDKIGYIKANTIATLRSKVKELDPSLENIEIKKMGYFIETSQIYNSRNELVEEKEEFQLVEILEEYDNELLIKTDDIIGKVAKEKISIIDGSFFAVDLSDQRIYYYCNNELVFVGKCTTGKKGSETEVGFFQPTYREKGHNFGPKHNNVESKILWEPFNGGQGLHDAPWQKPDTFGIPGYDETNGSEGCVRLPDEVATFIFNKTDTKDKVLVKE